MVVGMGEVDVSRHPSNVQTTLCTRYNMAKMLKKRVYKNFLFFNRKNILEKSMSSWFLTPPLRRCGVRGAGGGLMTAAGLVLLVTFPLVASMGHI